MENYRKAVLMTTVMSIIFEDLKYLADIKVSGLNCNIKNSALSRVREMLHLTHAKEGVIEHEKTIAVITVNMNNYSKIAKELFLIVDESEELKENLQLVKSRNGLENASEEICFILTGNPAREILKFKKKYSE